MLGGLFGRDRDTFVCGSGYSDVLQGLPGVCVCWRRMCSSRCVGGGCVVVGVLEEDV
jgi:hypothetical protein